MTMALPIGMAALGTLGSAAGALIGGGKSDFQAKGYYGNTDAGYDPNAAMYGGDAGGLQRRKNELNAWSQGQNARAAEYAQQQQQLHGQGMAGLAQANQARGQQVDAMNMARARATGAVPSIAGMQAQQDMQRVAAEQTSAAASARGPAALALAQQNAAANTAAAQQGISGQAQINAANERMAAEQSYAQQASGLRGSDVNQAGQAFGAGAQSGQLGVQRANLAQGYQKLQNDAEATAGQMRMQGQQINAQANSAAQGTNADTAKHNAENKGFIEKVGDFFSDERAKTDVVPLYEPEGKRLGVSDEGRAFYASTEPTSSLKARIASADGGGMSKAAASKAAAQKAGGKRGMSLDEMSAWADRELASQRAQNEAVDRAPSRTLDAALARSSADPMADANRAMAPSMYEYRPGFRETEGQVPGEKNVGPMAQNLARNPVTATAVRQDPQTGLLKVDGPKATMLTMGGLASVQRQIDELRELQARQKAKVA